MNKEINFIHWIGRYNFFLIITINMFFFWKLGTYCLFFVILVTAWNILHEVRLPRYEQNYDAAHRTILVFGQTQTFTPFILWMAHPY